jgi:hypothetical protein
VRIFFYYKKNSHARASPKWIFVRRLDKGRGVGQTCRGPAAAKKGAPAQKK